MAISRDRKRIIVRGLGLLEVLQVDPTPDTEFADVGYIKSTAFTDEQASEPIVDERGDLADVKVQSQTVTLESQMQQTTKDEVDLIRNADGKIYALRYSGSPQPDRGEYWCVEQARIVPMQSLTFQPGERNIPLKGYSIFLSDEKGFAVPYYYMNEMAKPMRVKNLHLWTDPILGHNSETAKILDISGFGRHGTLNSDFAAIWQQTTTPKEFLRFDGVNDQVDFTDINALDDDGVGDFVIEVWVRIQAANGIKTVILSKKSSIDTIGAGYAIFRQVTSNLLGFKLDDSLASTAILNSTTTLQNVWRHFAVSVDRNGNATPYLNGAVDGAATSVAAIASGANALSLFIGRDAVLFGQVDIGAVRIYRFGAGGLPSDIATIILNHFDGEKAKFGL